MSAFNYVSHIFNELKVLDSLLAKDVEILEKYKTKPNPVKLVIESRTDMLLKRKKALIFINDCLNRLSDENRDELAREFNSGKNFVISQVRDVLNSVPLTHLTPWNKEQMRTCSILEAQEKYDL
ncbi:MAG: hypothetical protein ACUZ8H_16355 [Candidatus Anammoxibacter sp.]